MTMQFTSDTGGAKELSKSYSSRSLQRDEEYSKFQQEVIRTKETSKEKGLNDSLAEPGHDEQNGAVMYVEDYNNNNSHNWVESDHEDEVTISSFRMDTSPVDQLNFFGSNHLVAELQEASDALEEMEDRVQIKLMVGEAVLKGILNALERDAAETVEIKEAELQKVKEQLQEKDFIVSRLISTLQMKEDEFVKLVEDSNCKECRLVMDMLLERERVVGKVKESEIFVANKEKDILKMAESMVELAMKLDIESKRVIQLEKQLEESKESKSSKAKEMTTMLEKNEQFRSQKDSVAERSKREARPKELCLSDSMVEKDKLLSDQLQRIKNLESAKKELREQVREQSIEVVGLVQSGKDSSKLLKKLTLEKKHAKDSLDARDRSLKLLQDDMEVLNARIQELLTEKSIIVDELCCHKAEIEAKEIQLEKQNIKLQDAKFRIQTVFISEQHLRQETSVMSASLQDYVEATQSLKMEMEDQNWKYEFETGIIMETLKGKVVELAEEINLLGDDSAGKESETIRFGSKILQKSHAELINSRFSKLILEEKIEKLNVVISIQKQSIEEKEKKLEEKVQALRRAENAISHLEEKLIGKELLLQNYKNEVQEIKCHEESLKMQQKGLEENAQLLREAEARICYLEQEVAVKDGLLQKSKNEIEEHSWRFEFEEKFISTYVVNSFQEFLRQLAEIKGNLVNAEEKLVNSQNELEVACDELRKSTSQVETLKSDVAASSTLVDELEAEIQSNVSELVQANVDLQNARSESERQIVIFSEDREEMNCLTMELEEILSKKREDVLEVLEKLEESDWKSEAQSAVILGLVEGSTQECAQEFAWLREELKLKHKDVVSLCSEIAEQNQRLILYGSDVSALKTALSSKNEELLAFRQETKSTQARQQDAIVLEQSVTVVALKEIEGLKKLKMTLDARIDEEKVRVQQLEEALLDQKWKDEVELDMVSTVVWEGGISMAALWNTERALILGEAQLHQELGRQQPMDREGDSNHVSRRVCHGSDGVIVDSCLVPPQGKFEPTKQSFVEPDSIALLVRQNLELRREKEQLLEQKTDEIYKLKREFYRDLENVKREWKSGIELKGLKRESSVLRYEADLALEGTESSKAASMEKTQLGNWRQHSEFRLEWDNEKKSLIESISQRDRQIKDREEQIKDISTRLCNTVEKKRNLVSSRALLVENLAVLEKEKNHLSSVHENEKENLIADYKKVLAEKNTEFLRAIKDIEEKEKHIAVLKGASSQSRDEIAVFRTEMMTIQKHLETDLGAKIQALVATSQQLEDVFSQRMKQYNLRLEGAQGLLKCLPRHALLKDADYLQNVHNLQKAETEVDMLGDEVDALMDILEKVYSVLNHYAPIIQHYPGLAELVKLVRQEVLQRICGSKEV